MAYRPLNEKGHVLGFYELRLNKEEIDHQLGILHSLIYLVYLLHLKELYHKDP